MKKILLGFFALALTSGVVSAFKVNPFNKVKSVFANLRFTGQTLNGRPLIFTGSTLAAQAAFGCDGASVKCANAYTTGSRHTPAPASDIFKD